MATSSISHYEALGLLRPAQRSPAGYRLYDEASVARLHAGLAYRYLGLVFTPIRKIRDDAASSPAHTLPVSSS